MLKKNLIKSKLKSFCKNNNIKLFILFGSCAINKNHKNSDIDLAVLLNKNPNKYQEKIFWEINKIFNFAKLDLVILNNADILLQFNVIQQGRILYEETKGEYFWYKLKVFKLYQDIKKFDKFYDYLIEKQIKKWKTTK